MMCAWADLFWCPAIHALTTMGPKRCLHVWSTSFDSVKKTLVKAGRLGIEVPVVSLAG